jgi:hypothetical protein
MFNLKCLRVLTNNVDGELKDRSGLGQLMKFTYHPSIKSSVDWFSVSITLKTDAFMHENMN